MRNKCSICSYRQVSPSRPAPIYHLHNSAKDVRILQGVEYKTDNLDYFCLTCQVFHKNRLPSGLNICVSTSQLHDFYKPKEQGVTCPPDTFHMDLVTMPGATISDLLHAWQADYHREWRPMRVLLVAGLNDFIKGGDLNSVKEEIRKFRKEVQYQDRLHPGLVNEFSVATLINPPKMVWFPDDGPPPPNHRDRQEELFQLNEWIDQENRENGRLCVPRFHLYGTRTGKRLVDGFQRTFKTHRWNEWRSSEPRHDMLHLSDKMRIKMARQVIRFFEGEYERHGHINYRV